MPDKTQITIETKVDAQIGNKEI